MMSKSSLKINYIYNVAYQLLTMLTPLITAPYISRVLGSSGVGLYSYTYSIANYFVLFSLLGVNNHGCRSIALAGDNKAERSRLFWEIYFAQVASSVLVLFAYIVFCFGLVDDSPEKGLFVAWILYVVSSVFDVSWLLFGLEKFKITTTRNAVIKIATIVMMFAFVKSADDVIVYVIIYAMGLLVSQLALWPFLLREVDVVLPSGRGVAQQFKSIAKLFIPVVAVSLYTAFDTVLLGTVSEMSEVGIFDYASRFVGIPISLINSLGVIMLPRMSSSEVNEDASGSYLLVSMGFVMSLVGAFSFGLIGISGDLSNTFLGPGFSGCEVVLNVMCLATPFIAWANVVRTEYLIPNMRDNSYIASVVAGAVVNVAAALLLVNSLGALGMSLAYLLAHIAVCLTQTLTIVGELPLRKFMAEGAPFLASGVLMSIAIRLISPFLGGSMVSLVVEIVFGAALYVALCLSVPKLFNNATAEKLSRIFFKALGHGREKKSHGNKS